MRLLFGFLGLGATLAYAEPFSIESVAESDWTSITVTAATVPVCPGAEIEPIYLSQNSGNYTIYRIKEDEYGGTYYSKGIPLLCSDFQKLIATLSSFYEKARNDETFSEYLAKLPHHVRRKELGAQDPKSGGSFSNFGGTYIIFSYLTSDGQEATIWEEFSDLKAFNEFLGWMKSIPTE